MMQRVGGILRIPLFLCTNQVFAHTLYACLAINSGAVFDLCREPPVALTSPSRPGTCNIDRLHDRQKLIIFPKQQHHKKAQSSASPSSSETNFTDADKLGSES